MDYSPTAWERAMRIQDVLLRAMSGEIHWFQAAEILQMTPRNLRRWRERYERWGYNGLVDQRRCPSKRRVPLTELERVLQLYRERYAGFNGRHFHEIACREHEVTLSYSYVKQALQQAGLLPKRKARGRHRRRREPRACLGELLHLDGSRHAWLTLVPDARGPSSRSSMTPPVPCSTRMAAGNDVGSDDWPRSFLGAPGRLGLRAAASHPGRRRIRLPSSPRKASARVRGVVSPRASRRGDGLRAGRGRSGHDLCQQDERVVAADRSGQRSRVADRQPGRRTCAGLRVLVRQHDRHPAARRQHLPDAACDPPPRTVRKRARTLAQA